MADDVGSQLRTGPPAIVRQSLAPAQALTAMRSLPPRLRAAANGREFAPITAHSRRSTNELRVHTRFDAEDGLERSLRASIADGDAVWAEATGRGSSPGSGELERLHALTLDQSPTKRIQVQLLDHKHGRKAGSGEVESCAIR